MNVIKVDNGIWIDGTKIACLQKIKIDSSADSISEVTLTLACKVEGLDIKSDEVIDSKLKKNTPIWKSK